MSARAYHPIRKAAPNDKLLDRLLPDDRESVVASYIALAVVARHEICARAKRMATDKEAAIDLLVQHAEGVINNHMAIHIAGQKPAVQVDGRLFPEIPFGVAFIEINPRNDLPSAVADALSESYQDLAISLKMYSTARELEATNGRMLPTQTLGALFEAMNTVSRPWPSTIQAAAELIS